MEVRGLERENGLWKGVNLGENMRNFKRRLETSEGIEKIWGNLRVWERI